MMKEVEWEAESKDRDYLVWEVEGMWITIGIIFGNDTHWPS